MNDRSAFVWMTVGLALLGLASPLSAQRAGMWTFNGQYSTVLPIGDLTRSFTDGFSWRGGTIDVERGATDRLSIGASVGWHLLSEQNATTSLLPDAALSGTALRHVNSVPLLVSGTVTLGSPGRVRPFFGAGGGLVWVENRTEAGPFVLEDTNWHRGAMGEVGVQIPRARSATITIAARYQRASEVNGVEREYVTFSLGYLLGG
ncbi:MAG: hypothetical protein ACPHWZ_01990 [Longimicrobiales bacterium]